MKKIFICLFLAFSFISCNSVQQKINVSEIPIKTNILDVSLCEKVDIDCTGTRWTEPMFLTGGIVFTPSWEQVTPNIVQYDCFPMTKDHYYCGGFKWTYLSIGTINDKTVFSISLIGTYKTKEEAKTQYEKIIEKLTEIYGKSNSRQNGAMWTDMINYIYLSYFESINGDGDMRGFCELRYRNISLEEQMSKELKNEF